MGTKDQLIIRVSLLRQGKTAEMFKVEMHQLTDVVKLCDQLILVERKYYLRKVNHSYRKRTYTSSSTLHPEEVRSDMCEVGAKIKVKWTPEELGDSGWRPGWYQAVVLSYDAESDLLTISYPVEEGCVYTIDLSSMLHKGTIKL